MKRIISLLTALCLVFVLVSCDLDGVTKSGESGSTDVLSEESATDNIIAEETGSEFATELSTESHEHTTTEGRSENAEMTESTEVNETTSTTETTEMTEVTENTVMPEESESTEVTETTGTTGTTEMTEVTENTVMPEESESTEVTEDTAMPEESESTEESETESPYLAPDFTVYDSEGNKVKLSDFRGKPIVLNFWARDCIYCTREMPDFQEAYEKYGDRVVFLMVCFTSFSGRGVEYEREYIDDNGYTFPVYYDTENSAVSRYGINSIPQTFFINSDFDLYTYIPGMASATALETCIGYILE